MPEEVQLTTSDEVNISGTYQPSTKANKPAVLLLHQLRKDRTIWNNIIGKLSDSGYSSFAIDFRGHGQSGGGEWANFTTFQFQQMKNDVAAAGKFLRDKLPTANIAVIGSSIGANLGFNYAAKSNISSVALLSPGLDYKGVTTQESASGFHKPLFMAASSDDTNPSVESIKRISELVITSPSDIKIVTYTEGGHGVAMFEKHPDLQDQILQWLR